jgi:hypothetical protein
MLFTTLHGWHQQKARSRTNLASLLSERYFAGVFEQLVRLYCFHLKKCSGTEVAKKSSSDWLTSSRHVTNTLCMSRLFKWTDGAAVRFRKKNIGQRQHLVPHLVNLHGFVLCARGLSDVFCLHITMIDEQCLLIRLAIFALSTKL